MLAMSTTQLYRVFGMTCHLYTPTHYHPVRASMLTEHPPEGNGDGDRAHRHPDGRGQGSAACGRHGLEPIYEHDFLDCSYGFRPGRSAHQALEALWQQAMALGGCWLVEVDIRKFFDTLDHAHLRALLRQRVRDGVLLRLIDKWLSAGVLEGWE